MHCDALSNEGVLQATKENLTGGECFLQCFAAFVSTKENRFQQANHLIDKFYTHCRENGYHPVTKPSELKKDKINALLTVEEGGAIEGDLEKLEALYARGVRMMSLTWNYRNELGAPCFPDYDGLKWGDNTIRLREKGSGLTPLGERAILKMNELGMMIDVSHGSDRLLSDALFFSRKPIVASHSNAREAFDCARNLNAVQIKAIAQNGGVVGLNFCAEFLSEDKSEQGQAEAVLSHARAILNVGGEDCLAIGSDFDGIKPNPYLKTPADISKLLSVFEREFGARLAEKIAYRNFLRVFQEVCQ